MKNNVYILVGAGCNGKTSFINDIREAGANINQYDDVGRREIKRIAKEHKQYGLIALIHCNVDPKIEGKNILTIHFNQDLRKKFEKKNKIDDKKRASMINKLLGR